ncbi:helix-turn-helix domain-containing protein [uncultured Enterovirga sp.]|uniref:helix-turn-helix domain-containing protein n=1 Tax=uncultured Enterovirga sp. TaxID=2026352 RepID=UPI0035CBF092
MSKRERVEELGVLLRGWRGVRGRTQLELSFESGISQRHISFVETGRSIPGRRTLMELAQALDVPFRERNALLLAAGYAPVYAESAWDAPEMGSLNAALQRMLRQHDPYPAIVMDRYWNVVMANDAAPRFFGSFIDMSARKGPRNMLLLIFDPEGMRPFVHDWDSVARALVERVRREAVGRVIDEPTKELLASLMSYPNVRADWDRSGPVGPTPVIPLGFVKDGLVLNYFSIVSTVGTPQTITAQELRIECMFPADHATEARHAAIMAAAAPTSGALA